MARTLYALLVGIDKYAGPVRPLNGCVNDIQWFDQYLQNAGTTVKTVRLLNDQATRQAIIQGFREHLAQAGPDDGVLFVYCGHGSQAPAPPEFWDIEPDHKNETLVCHDSRTTAWDLADKEVAQLLAEVTATGAHVVVVLDCCHSGSGTRGETEARQIPGDDRPRPADTFLYTPAQAAAHMPAARDAAPGRLEWTGARYVLLAACASDQTAKEYCADGTQRGAFSYFLADTLQRASGPLSYYELFGRAAALVESHVLDQTPQLETHANDLLGGVFLSGVLKDPQQERRVYADQAGRWIVDAGAMHGIRLETPDNTTVLALFPFDLPSTGFADPTNRRGTATVTEVRPTQSSVTLKLADGSNPRPDEVYKAVVTQAPFERLPVALSGEEPGVQAARRALNLVGNGAPSLYVREARPGETPTLILTAGAGSYTIRRPADAQPLTAPLSGYESSAMLAARRLEHIVRWQLTQRLANDASSLGPDDIQIVVTYDGKDSTEPELRLEYRPVNGRWTQPTFKAKITNQSKQRLYCAILSVADDFEVSTQLMPSGGVWLNPGEAASALDGKPVFASVPRERWEQGITEFRDCLLVLASTAEFDPRLLEQPRLDFPRPETRGVRTLSRTSTFQRLLAQTGSRSFSPTPDEIDDWQTYRRTFTVVRPPQAIDVPSSPAEKRPLLGELALEGHPRFKAKVQVISLAATRGEDPLPVLPTDDPSALQPYHPIATRGAGPSMSVIELSDVGDVSVVTSADPLRFQLGNALQEGERILSLTRAGDLWIPVGWSERLPDGAARLNVFGLPTPRDKPGAAQPSRSIGSAIKLYLYKIVGKVVGQAPLPVRLAAAQVKPDETVVYDGDAASVQRKVSDARRVLLFIHGILGDTSTMLPSVRLAKVGNHGRCLADAYDLVLACDYENLNTPIAETARALKDALARVGLAPGHAKELHIVAHSMGGLVSRWFIEREGGNRIATRLVMLGTPNGGSPWPTVQSIALTGLTLGLNGLCGSAWPGRVLSGLSNLIGRHDVTLDQMKAGSEVLRALEGNPDPNFPYVLVAGDTRLPTSLRDDAEKRSWLQRLAACFNPAKALEFMADPLFFWNPNDIAVSVASMKTFGAARTPAVDIHDVSCDHLNYFTNPASLRLLVAALAPPAA